jgi:hypothetical protein
MIPARSKWIGALLLSSTLTAGAAEPSSTSAPAAAESADAATAAAPLARSLDLRGADVRAVVRATASTQAAIDYHIERAAPPERTDAELATTLKTPVVAEKRPYKVLLPVRPAKCDGFVSCGIETLLGLEDFDDNTYGRVQRHRLMNEGSFMDKSSINASVPMPKTPEETQEATRQVRP